jgi:hypothetical protein
MRLKVTSEVISRKHIRWNYWLLKVYKKLNFSNIYIEKNLKFDEKFFLLKDNSYLDGYFQSEKYFVEMKEILRDEFSLVDQLPKKYSLLDEKIKSINSVAIHVRRGDYLSNKDTLRIHGVCSIDYYTNAINLIKERVSDPIFYIFSDDINWVKNNLDLPENSEFIDGNENRPEIDLTLMMSCKHFIIANSSFSWWGAWLSSFESKVVIAPTPWFDDANYVAEDIYSKQWIRLAK